MPRIVPSQVVQYIKEIRAQELPNGLMRMSSIGAAPLSTLLRLTEGIPDELLTLDGDEYGSFATAQEQIREMLKTWRDNRTANQNLFGFDVQKASNPLYTIRDLLVSCQDESPSPSASELKFISDPDLRSVLRNDMGAINRALANGEWKATTVLAGSVIEALLLWKLQLERPARIAAAATALTAAKTFRKDPGPDLQKWVLHEYTEVADALRLVAPDTIQPVRLAREFRNLIHPGKAQRVGQKCDRATALSAVAGVEHVIRDLT